MDDLDGRVEEKKKNSPEENIEYGKKLYVDFRKKCIKNLTSSELETVDRAFETANKFHSAQLRDSGEPYIMHPIAVADIVLDLGLDCESICAALLHDTVEDTSYSLEQLKADFGGVVANLVDGVTKVNRIDLYGKEENEQENLRKMLMAMNTDIRVILIKLADRVHNSRTWDAVTEEKARRKAKETLEIYAPIAHRLGIRRIKEELEDTSIRYLDPVAYNEILLNLQKNEEERTKFLNKIVGEITDKVSEEIPGSTVSGRIKSVHGIYRKMYVKNKSFSEIYDIYAVRIIVNTRAECYNCLGIIHDMYSAIPGRFKDYIAMPKSNNYQSLHTTVISPEKIPFEVQIRTYDMHKNAEYGVAAHWKYKLGRKDTDVDPWVNWVRELLEQEQESDAQSELLTEFKGDLLGEEVYALTPKGTVISLPQGSTVIDFAYAIHTQVGNKMTGAKVDGKIVPIDSKVQTGQVIEILTSTQPGKGPSRDWLSIVKTSGARSKIRTWFKKEKRDENIQEGKNILERELKRNNIHLNVDDIKHILELLVEKHKQPGIDDLFAAMGYGAISVSKIIPPFKDEQTRQIQKQEAEQKADQIKVAKPTQSSGDGVIVEGIDNCLVKLAKCCTPIPGDEIIGFITRGRGVSVHKKTCTNVPSDIYSGENAGRWIPVRWEENSKKQSGFNAGLSIYCLDRTGLLADVSILLSNMHVPIHAVNTRTAKDGSFVIGMNIAVNSYEHLKAIMIKLEKIDGVLKVERD